jgi:hypothetical protein
MRHFNQRLGLIILPLVGAALLHADTGPILNTANGHWYFAKHAFETSWINANTAATASGGHLATITSQDEETFIENNLNEALGTPTNLGYWIGGQQSSPLPNLTFVWVNGEPFGGYTNWDAGEPNGDPNGAIHFKGQGATPGKWNDAPGNLNCGGLGDCNLFPFQGYVVEFEPTVITIQGCITGVPDRPLLDGSSTLALGLNACAQADPKNHGAYDNCVAAITNTWVSQGLITGIQKGAIQSCAARSTIGK